MTGAGLTYLLLVITGGVLAIAASVYQLFQHPLGYQWYMLAALTLISGSATVTLPSVGASISVSETFVFASVLLFGPAGGTVMVALDGLVISFWLARRRREWYRAPFNMAAPAVSIWIASHLLFAIAGIEPLFNQTDVKFNSLLFPLIVFALVYFGLNSWFIAIAVAFEKNAKPYEIWRKNFLWLSLNYFSGASVALLLVVYTRDVDLRFIGVIVPLLLVLYFTFKTTMGRVDDANKHLQQLNRLYLSTIETLAMAIDAKDQITHGHIRRVQHYAVGLAREIGISDDTLIKAIEAAALLHDMGKLAVPEYILNKPGKLTPAEFEKMKAHATVGADILAAVDFPYPVVPIVRHHHESWDGSGYPHGIKGTDIPIGARILSVVDCFDALTSDRPYRPRLSDEEALAILRERRGSMYDPLVVDTFIRVHKQIAPEQTSQVDRNRLTELASTTQTVPVADGAQFDEISASSDEMQTLYELARTLSGNVTVDEIGTVMTRHLCRLVPFSVAVFYAYDATHDELETSYISGDLPSSARGIRIPLGERLSGWVAANRQSILNSDAVLDLGELGRAVNPRLRTCLSVPLTFDKELVGVITLYSNTQEGFSEEHRRVLEVVGRQVAHAFQRAVGFETSSRQDIVTGLPKSVQIDLFDPTLTQNAQPVLIDIVDLQSINARYGRAAGDEVLRTVAAKTRAHLRTGDMIFRHESDEFVVLLNHTELGEARMIGRQLSERLSSFNVEWPGAGVLQVRAVVTCVSFPIRRRNVGHDGTVPAHKDRQANVIGTAIH